MNRFFKKLMMALILAISAPAFAAAEPGPALIGAKFNCVCSGSDSSVSCQSQRDLRLSIVRRDNGEVVWGRESLTLNFDSRCELITVLGNTVPVSEAILNAPADDFWLRIECLKGCGTRVQNVSFVMAQKGPKGDDGERGQQGASGAKGEKGDIGATGAIGPVGPTGLPGPAGAAGATGAIGPVGPVGPTGLPGPAGAAGATGAIGPVGPTGLSGPAGIQGDAGPQGVAGRDGSLDVLFSQNDFGLIQVATPQFSGQWFTSETTAALLGQKAARQHTHSTSDLTEVVRCVGPVIASICVNDDSSLSVKGITYVPAPLIGGRPVRADYMTGLRTGSVNTWNLVGTINAPGTKRILYLVGSSKSSQGLDVMINASTRLLARVIDGRVEEYHNDTALSNQDLVLTVHYTN